MLGGGPLIVRAGAHPARIERITLRAPQHPGAQHPACPGARKRPQLAISQHEQGEKDAPRGRAAPEPAAGGGDVRAREGGEGSRGEPVQGVGGLHGGRAV